LSALASPPVSGPRFYLTLRARNQTFALPIEFARSVFRIEDLTRLPLAPPHCIGVTNLNGAIVAIACLARRLDAGAQVAGAGALAVAIQIGAETFALAVQDVGQIIHGTPESISNSDDPSAPASNGGFVRSGALGAPILDPLRIFDF
jgi:chemotaxis signal transduction protein